MSLVQLLIAGGLLYLAALGFCGFLVSQAPGFVAYTILGGAGVAGITVMFAFLMWAARRGVH